MSIYIGSFIVVIGVLIFFHELGHFLVARLFGVGVEVFSLGFGPRLIGKKSGITDYRISAVPLGGYVKMVGEEPNADLKPSEIPLSFTHKHVFKRFLIVAAGPVFNFLLAIFIFYSIYQFSGIRLIKPVIRDIDIDSPADDSGIKRGDLVVAINDAPIACWNDIAQCVSNSKGERLKITLLREQSRLDVNLTPELRPALNEFREKIEKYQLGLSPLPDEPVIGSVTPGSPADGAGLKNGDLIKSIDGVEISTWEAMQKIVSSCNGKKLSISISRGESVFSVDIIPKQEIIRNNLGEEVKVYLVGIVSKEIDLDDENIFFKKRLNPFEAFSESINKTCYMTKLTILAVVKLIQGTLPLKAMGGPISIAQMAGQQAKEGPGNFMFLIAFISVNLAMLNLLPIPVLDGGHLLFYFIEVVIRKPVKVEIREKAQAVGMAALLTLMFYIIYIDIMKNKYSIINIWENIKNLFC